MMVDGSHEARGHVVAGTIGLAGLSACGLLLGDLDVTLPDARPDSGAREGGEDHGGDVGSSDAGAPPSPRYSFGMAAR
jgi:hypothetical protein